jgi:hypothetical protein
MTQTETRSPRDWIGRSVVDGSGRKIGKVAHVYVGDLTGEPEWITVKTGVFSRPNCFVPLAGVVVDGDTLMVPYSRDMVKRESRR